MPYIELDDNQFPLRVGEAARVGGRDAHIPLPGHASSAPAAVIECGASGDDVFIRRADDESDVRVNGVRLGAEPTPLIHGDKIEVGGHELLFGDDRRSGNTLLLATDEVHGRLSAQGGTATLRPPARPTASTGGRLVSLVDGREYTVPQSGITIGRDAGCDVVVPSTDVSRRHAQLLPREIGYVLRDMSTNGVYVNDERVDAARVLGRGDVLRVGTEEFRFYADEPAPALEAAPRDAGAPAAAAAHAPRAVPSLADTIAGPVFADLRPVLATLEIVNQGVLRGQRYELRTPLVHVGRGAHNDVVIADDSVSETHAKLQKREAGWYVVDMDSTNGTYVAGTRITGEQRLVGTPDVRFGGVKMAFQPAAGAAEDAGGTRAIAGARAAASAVASAAAPTPRPAGDAPAPPRARGAAPPADSPPAAGRGSALIWLVGAAAVGAAVYYLMQGR